MSYDNSFPDESQEGDGNERQNNWGNRSGGGSGYNGNNGGGGFRGNNNYDGQRGNFNRSNYGKGNNSGFNRGQGGGGGFRKSNYQNKEEDDGIVLYKSYAIAYNKEIPSDVAASIKRIATELEEFSYIMRISSMDPIDDQLEAAVKKKELHLPWRGFNGKESKSYFNTAQAMNIAKMFHTAFDGLKPSIQAILAKNARMVLGKDLRSPCMFVLCWSEDGAENSKEKTAKTGNIGHLIAIASSMKIPVFNFGKPDAEARLKKYLELPNGQEQTIS